MELLICHARIYCVYNILARKFVFFITAEKGTRKGHANKKMSPSKGAAYCARQTPAITIQHWDDDATYDHLFHDRSVVQRFVLFLVGSGSSATMVVPFRLSEK